MILSSRNGSVGTSAPRVERVASLACAVAALGALVFLGSRFLPTPQGLLGHDYGLFLPHLLIGENWFRQNGFLEPPYFTPAFCGGMPWLGNPQSIVFSVPQAFAVFLDPIESFFATLVVFASAGAVGMFGLLRHGFRTSTTAATLGAILFLLNGFLIYRMAVGHVTFHVFSVAPLVGWVLLHPAGTRAARGVGRAWQPALRTVLSGCLLGYVTYGGALHLIIPIVLTVACAVLLLQIRGGFRAREWMMLAGACLWAVLVSAMKLAPAAVLAAKFPRSYLPTYLFNDPVRFVTSLGLGFFAPEFLSDGVAMGSHRATLGRHEYEFGLSIVPAVLLGLTCWRIGLKQYVLGRFWLCTALVSILLVPVVLTLGPDWWGRLLLEVPVIRNNTTLVRWWLIYIIPLIVAAALSLDWLTRAPMARAVVLMLSTAVVIGQSTLRSVRYYTHPSSSYDPAPILAADRSLRAGGTLPPIERVGHQTGPRGRDAYFAQNDAFLSGTSAWPCYDGLLGYWLELLPDTGLREGPALAVSDDGRFNLVDPATYLRNQSGGPTAARFEADHLGRARAFASYRPIRRAEPTWQRIATAVTVMSILVSWSALGLAAFAALIRAVRFRGR